MKKGLIILFLFVAFKSNAQYVLSADTTISSTWNLGSTILKVNPGVKIHGTGTITGGYIDASYYQNIFDTTLSIGIYGGAYGKISSSWFGASPSNANNVRYFQKAIDATINRNMILYTPSGVYNDSSALLIAQYYSGNYQAVSLKWEGDYVYNGAIAGTVIKFNNKGATFCIGMQMAKGVEIRGMSLVGGFVAQTGGGGQGYYNQTMSNFQDPLCSNYLYGVVVDPFIPTSGSSGSTGILFSDLSVTGFTSLFAISPNGVSLNAEEITADRIVFGTGKIGWLSGQPQEKQNVIKNSMAWGALYYFYYATFLRGSGMTSGTGNYHIHDINVAGSVINLFYINQSGWFPTKIDNIYAEGIGSIGELYTAAMGISISNSVFAFAYKSQAGNQYLVTSNSTSINFRNCDFTYFGVSDSLSFNGPASFDRCTFSGVYQNQQTGSTFSSNCQFLN